MLLRILFSLIFLASVQIQAQTVEIVQSDGWLESAFVKWTPVDGADSYNVYLSGEGIVDQKLDNPLIRSYGTFYRADAVGLKGGSYTLKVVPVSLHYRKHEEHDLFGCDGCQCQPLRGSSGNS
ncbi:MAG: hypothetical protein LC643_08940 [Bacteroidales bacterium]|nr:hypothetical protein [Bacteroidales bacterium]